MTGSESPATSHTDAGHDAAAATVAGTKPPRASVFAPLQYIGRPLAGLEGLVESYGDVVRVRVGPEMLCLVADPAAVKQVLTSEADSFDKGHLQQQYLGPIVGNGILLSDGDHWMSQRSTVQPAFGPQRFPGYADTVATYTASLADDWTDGETVRLADALQPLTLRILATTLFDLEIGPVTETFSETGKVITDRFDFTELTTFLPEWLPLPKHRRYRRALGEFDEALYDLIAERRSAMETDGPADVLSMLLEVCDDDAIRDEVATILLGGHDTSALAIAYTLYLVAADPAIERGVRAELDAIEGAPTHGDVESLAYTERVVREAMRLYPPAYSVFREPTEPVTVGGYRLEPGTTVVLPQWLCHRDDRWWDDPEQARPERWAGDTDRPDYAYFPFSGGPRGCIGREFAMVEILVAVATLLDAYTFEVVDDGPLSFRPSLTLQPEDGLPMRVHER